MINTFITEQEILIQLSRKYEEYNSFVNAKGIKRTKAVKWAISELISNNTHSNLDIRLEFLLQKVGWSTFIALGLYMSLLPLLDKSENSKIKKISHTLKLIINDINEFTDIGNIISLGVSIEHSNHFNFARVDDAGNIFIFPSDAETLFIEIEENLL